MNNNSTYSLFPVGADSVVDNQLGYFDYPKRKKGKKKKGKKKKMKKYDKFVSDLLNDKKGKKGKKSKDKSKKQSKRELQYRLIEKSTDTFLDTASDIARMYAESKFFPSGRSK